MDAPVALVVGGSRGIGRATVLELARRGYAVSVGYHQNEAAAVDVVDAAVEAGSPQAMTVGGDLQITGSVFVVRLNRGWRPVGLIAWAGTGGPMVAGAAFAIAWTPCVGPTLGAILGLASTQRGTAQGALLLAVYSAGLALPFLFSAVAFNAATRAFGVFKRHYAAIQLGAGVVLVAMGVLVLTGELFRLNIEAQRLLSGLHLNFFQSV